MSQHAAADGLKRPLIFDRVVQLFETRAPTRRAPLLVTFPLIPGVGGIVDRSRHPAAQIHRDRGIATSIPDFHPAIERGPSTPMNQHHGRMFLLRIVTTGGGRTIVGKNSSRFSFVGNAFVEERFNPGNLQIRRGINLRRLGKRFQVEAGPDGRLELWTTSGWANCRLVGKQDRLPTEADQDQTNTW